MPVSLKPFDPNRDFVARTAFRCAGRLYGKDTPFDKFTVNERLLESLYQQRKIGFAEKPGEDRSPRTKAHKRMGKLLASFAASVLAHRRWDHHGNSEGASGPAREAPSATLLGVAEPEQSGERIEDRAPAEGEAGGPESSASPTIAEAAASEPAPADAEAAAAPAGEAGTVAADREAKIDQLMIDHSQTKLLDMAKGLEGAHLRTPKRDLAALLVDAGRA
jgi:hypothetical protein